MNETKQIIRQIIKEELPNIIDKNKKYEFSYDEMYYMNRDLYKIYDYLTKQTNLSPELSDRKNRLKKIITLFNKKF